MNSKIKADNLSSVYERKKLNETFPIDIIIDARQILFPRNRRAVLLKRMMQKKLSPFDSPCPLLV